MFTRILVPLNAGPATTDAVSVARSLTCRMKADLITLPLPTETSTDEKEFILLSAALTERADLIVLPEEPASDLRKHRRIRVPTTLLAASVAPVLFMPPTRPGAVRSEPLSLTASFVIAPLDGSEEAERALPYAVALAERCQRVLLLIHVIPMHTLSFTGVEEFAIEEEAHSGLQYLRAIRLRLATQSDVAVESMQLHGNVADALTQLMRAHESSLIVLTSRGGEAPDDHPRDGVTDELIERGRYPLMVIPPELARYQAPIRAGSRDATLVTAQARST